MKRGQIYFIRKIANKIHILPDEVSDSLSETNTNKDRSSLENFNNGSPYIMTEPVFYKNT